MKIMLVEIFKKLAVLEKQFNEIKYPPETTFRPSFSRQIRKAESECIKKDFPAFEIGELLKGIEHDI